MTVYKKRNIFQKFIGIFNGENKKAKETENKNKELNDKISKLTINEKNFIKANKSYIVDEKNGDNLETKSFKELMENKKSKIKEDFSYIPKSEKESSNLNLDNLEGTKQFLMEAKKLLYTNKNDLEQKKEINKENIEYNKEKMNRYGEITNGFKTLQDKSIDELKEYQNDINNTIKDYSVENETEYLKSKIRDNILNKIENQMNYKINAEKIDRTAREALQKEISKDDGR